MLAALNHLEALKERYKYQWIGPASDHLHLAICEMQSATADVLLLERQRADENPRTDGGEGSGADDTA